MADELKMNENKSKEVIFPDGTKLQVEGGTQILMPFYPNPKWVALTPEEKGQQSAKRLRGDTDCISMFAYKKYRLQPEGDYYIAVFVGIED